MLQKLLGFAKILNEFQKVERVIRVQGSERWENDVEHSYDLAMLAWYILSTTETTLDHDRVIRYALIHDFLEVYAGDTYNFSTDAAHIASKHEREAAAVVKLRETLAEFTELHETIDAYEKRADAESRFVYALDKIDPLIQTYLDDGRVWKEKGISIEMVYENKKDRVALSPEIQAYFDEFMILLRKEEKKIFGSENVKGQ